MFIEVKVVGSPAEIVDREFTPPGADTTLRGLLGELVAAQVADYEQRRTQQQLLHVLTDRDIVVKCVADGGDPTSVTAGSLAQGKPVTIGADAEPVATRNVGGLEDAFQSAFRWSASTPGRAGKVPSVSQ